MADKVCPRCGGFGEIVVKDEFGEPHCFRCGECRGDGVLPDKLSNQVT